MKVGIFDSGMGGLSVLHQAVKRMPGVQFIYYADEAHVPYGEKTKEQILGFIDEIMVFMMEKKVDAVLIACNTATVIADKEYRKQFPVPIIGMEPAVKKAVEQFEGEDGRILVAATPVTIAGDKLHNLLDLVDQHHEVDLVALPGLVRYAEKQEFESEEVVKYLKEAFEPFTGTYYKAFVLGCTHFNYFKRDLIEVLPEGVQFVDGNDGAIRQLLRMLPEEVDQNAKPLEEPIEYYFSGEPVSDMDKKKIQQYLQQLELVVTI